MVQTELVSIITHRITSAIAELNTKKKKSSSDDSDEDDDVPLIKRRRAGGNDDSKETKGETTKGTPIVTVSEVKAKDQVPFFSDMALEQVARKVASISGDVRRCLELCMYTFISSYHISSRLMRIRLMLVAIWSTIQ
jgi:Cdc6-like AAA superfamily ATPase